MPSITVENYLKTLYLAQQQADGPLVPIGRLADAMRVVPGTATSMVKTLEEAGLVDYRPREGVRLTGPGEKLALHVLRRHRLVELFLVEVLGLDWSEVHDEAEELEHAISDKVMERIDAYLGRPTADPHGDPIPTAKGTVASRSLETLAEAMIGQAYQIAQVANQDPQFLRFMEAKGLTPVATLVVTERDAAADSVTLQRGDAAPMTIGTAAARMILVTRDRGGREATGA